jgi:hypothetical protein
VGLATAGRARRKAFQNCQATLQTRLRGTKKPGAVSRPGALREFQFPEYSDLLNRVKQTVVAHMCRTVLVDNSTSPVTFWVGSNHDAALVKVERLD